MNPSRDRLRLAKALGTMSAEWGETIEKLLEDIDAEDDANSATLMVLELLDAEEIPHTLPHV